jgi:formate dehydrogenase major subunit
MEGADGRHCTAGLAVQLVDVVTINDQHFQSPHESSIINVMFKTRKPTRAYDRLSQPLVRERGALRPASWDEALDRAAAGFRRNIDAHGPNALGIFSCSKSTNEVNFMAQKIARVAFGTNNIDSCNRT